MKRGNERESVTVDEKSARTKAVGVGRTVSVHALADDNVLLLVLDCRRSEKTTEWVLSASEVVIAVCRRGVVASDAPS